MLYLTVVLIISALANVLLFWFARRASSRLTIVASNIDEIMTALDSFQEHLESLYEMETFYGDETLHSVILHAKGVTEFLSEFEDIYELSDEFTDEEQWEEAGEDNKKDGAQLAN